MKIHQLAIGARFLYQGEEYVKTGPMFGTGSSGQKLIPRSAVVQALDATASQTVTPVVEDKLGRVETLAAFEVFYAECHNLVDVDRLIALNRAREQFLQALG